MQKLLTSATAKAGDAITAGVIDAKGAILSAPALTSERATPAMEGAKWNQHQFTTGSFHRPQLTRGAQKGTAKAHESHKGNKNKRKLEHRNETGHESERVRS